MEVTPLFFALVVLVNMVVLGLGVVWMLTRIRRNLQLLKADGDGSKQDQVLDAMERIEIRLSVMSDRLAELEEGQKRRLGSGDEGGGGDAGPTSE